MAGGYVYHGRTPSDDRWSTALDGVIPGSTFSIYDVSTPDPEEARDYRARNLFDLPGEVEGVDEASITGGVTENLGAAVKFHTSLSEIGAVFVLDRSRVGAGLTRIEYNYEWASDHPGTYARIDSIDDFEVYRDDRLVAAGYHRRSDDVPIVNKWTEQLRNRIDSFAYADEAELAAYGADQIDFRSGLFGTASYLHTKRVVGGSVQGALTEHPGFTAGYPGRDQEDVTRMDDEELARRFQRLFTSLYAGPGSVIRNSHMVVLYDEALRMRDATVAIPPEHFILAFDGNTVYRDPTDVDIYLGDSR